MYDFIFLVFCCLEINTETEEVSPWSWISSVVDAVSDFRVKPFVRRDHQGVLHSNKHIQERAANHVFKVVTRRDMVEPEKKRLW